MAETPPEHPAKLGVIGRTWASIKHVAGKALKWGGYGALVGGAVGLPLTLLSAFTAGPVMGAIGGVIGTGLGFIGLGGVGSFFGLGGAAGGAVVGSGGGALIGGVGGFALGAAAPVILGALAVGGVAAGIGLLTGLMGAGEAADEASERAEADYDRNEARQQRQQALERRQRQEDMAMSGGGSEPLRPNAPMRPGRNRVNPQI